MPHSHSAGHWPLPNSNSGVIWHRTQPVFRWWYKEARQQSLCAYVGVRVPVMITTSASSTPVKKQEAHIQMVGSSILGLLGYGITYSKMAAVIQRQWQPCHSHRVMIWSQLFMLPLFPALGYPDSCPWNFFSAQISQTPFLLLVPKKS